MTTKLDSFLREFSSGTPPRSWQDLLAASLQKGAFQKISRDKVKSEFANNRVLPWVKADVVSADVPPVVNVVSAVRNMSAKGYKLFEVLGFGADLERAFDTHGVYCDIQTGRQLTPVSDLSDTWKLAASIEGDLVACVHLIGDSASAEEKLWGYREARSKGVSRFLVDSRIEKEIDEARAKEVNSLGFITYTLSTQSKEHDGVVTELSTYLFDSSRLMIGRLALGVFQKEKEGGYTLVSLLPLGKGYYSPEEKEPEGRVRSDKDVKKVVNEKTRKQYLEASLSVAVNELGFTDYDCLQDLPFVHRSLSLEFAALSRAEQICVFLFMLARLQGDTAILILPEEDTPGEKWWPKFLDVIQKSFDRVGTRVIAESKPRVSFEKSLQNIVFDASLNGTRLNVFAFESTVRLELASAEKKNVKTCDPKTSLADLLGISLASLFCVQLQARKDGKSEADFLPGGALVCGDCDGFGRRFVEFSLGYEVGRVCEACCGGGVSDSRYIYNGKTFVDFSKMNIAALCKEFEGLDRVHNPLQELLRLGFGDYYLHTRLFELDFSDCVRALIVSQKCAPSYLAQCFSRKSLQGAGAKEGSKFIFSAPRTQDLIDKSNLLELDRVLNGTNIMLDLRS